MLRPDQQSLRQIDQRALTRQHHGPGFVQRHPARGVDLREGFDLAAPRRSFELEEIARYRCAIDILLDGKNLDRLAAGRPDRAR
jgi:hypothetical protein